MGIYLNPNNDNFTEITSREIYVDKTMMISVLNRIMKVSNKYICVSRPIQGIFLRSTKSAKTQASRQI